MQGLPTHACACARALNQQVCLSSPCRKPHNANMCSNAIHLAASTGWHLTATRSDLCGIPALSTATLMPEALHLQRLCSQQRTWTQHLSWIMPPGIGSAHVLRPLWHSQLGMTVAQPTGSDSSTAKLGLTVAWPTGRRVDSGTTMCSDSQ
jgi:hypothetical protein